MDLRLRNGRLDVDRKRSALDGAALAGDELIARKPNRVDAFLSKSLESPEKCLVLAPWDQRKVENIFAIGAARKLANFLRRKHAGDFEPFSFGISLTSSGMNNEQERDLLSPIIKSGSSDAKSQAYVFLDQINKFKPGRSEDGAPSTDGDDLIVERV